MALAAKGRLIALISDSLIAIAIWLVFHSLGVNIVFFVQAGPGMASKLNTRLLLQLMLASLLLCMLFIAVALAMLKCLAGLMLLRWPHPSR